MSLRTQATAPYKHTAKQQRKVPVHCHKTNDNNYFTQQTTPSTTYSVAIISM